MQDFPEDFPILEGATVEYGFDRDNRVQRTIELRRTRQGFTWFDMEGQKISGELATIKSAEQWAKFELGIDDFESPEAGK